MQGQNFKNQYYLYMLSNGYEGAEAEKEKMTSFTIAQILHAMVSK